MSVVRLIWIFINNHHKLAQTEINYSIHRILILMKENFKVYIRLYIMPCRMHFRDQFMKFMLTCSIRVWRDLPQNPIMASSVLTPEPYLWWWPSHAEITSSPSQFYKVKTNFIKNFSSTGSNIKISDIAWNLYWTYFSERI